ncbi:MAG: outer membrane beta-barrel domain-containing protein [Myxococcota bacterium]
MNRFTTLVAAGVLVTASTRPVSAQETPAEAPPVPEVVPDDGAPFSRVIDDEETIYAIQRKAYLIKGKFEVTPMYSTLVGDRFVATENSIAGHLSVAYHLSEQFAFEIFGGVYNPTESETTSELLDQLKLETEQAKLTHLQGAAGAGFQWSPVYGKLQFAGVSLGNFAFYLGLGAAAGITRVQCKGTEQLDPNTFDPDPAVDAQVPRCQQDSLEVAYEPSQVRFMGTFSAGVRFRFLSWLGLKAEIRDYIFTSRVYRPDANVYSDSVRNNLFLNVGVSFLFGGESN